MYPPSKRYSDEFFNLIGEGEPVIDDYSLATFQREVDNVVNFIMTDRRIQKELNASYLRDEIISLLGRLSTGLANQYKHFMPTDDIEKCKRFMDIYCMIMDVYGLARMFRHFSDGTYPKHIIVNAGATHGEMYKVFLQSLGLFRDIAYSENFNQTCLSISRNELW